MARSIRRGELSQDEIKRLNKYIEVLASAAGAKVSMGDFVLSIDDVSPRLVKSDLFGWGVQLTDELEVESTVAALKSALKTNGLLTEEVGLRFCGSGVAETLRRQIERAKPVELARAIEQKKAFVDWTCRIGELPLSLLAVSIEEAAKNHQINGAVAVADQFLGSAIIADEVGIGKTLTGLLAMFELQIRYGLERLLIVTPPNLVNQWKSEISRFFPDANLYPNLAERIDPAKLSQEEFVIVSYRDLIDHEKRSKVLENSWGVVVFDEAHHLRNPDTKTAKYCFCIRSPFRVLLTATPVQNDVMDLHSLVTFLRPGFLSSTQKFTDLFVGPNRELLEPEVLRERIRGIVLRRKRGKETVELAPRRVAQRLVDGPYEHENEFYEKVIEVYRSSYRMLLQHKGVIVDKQSEKVTISAFTAVAMVLLRQIASHPLAGLGMLDGLFSKYVAIIQSSGGDAKILSLLEDLKNKYGEEYWVDNAHSKSDALVEELRRFFLSREADALPPKVVIFTEWLVTFRVLRSKLEGRVSMDGGADVRVFSLSGGDSRDRKTEIADAFCVCNEPSILLCSDCAAEGLNLQEARALFNYDFPWNPMRMEQRIGRIDRIAKDDSSPEILNFVTERSFDGYVYRVLAFKLYLFQEIFGDFIPPIPFKEFDRFFDRRIGRIIGESRDYSEMQDKFSDFLRDSATSFKESERHDRNRWLDAFLV